MFDEYDMACKEKYSEYFGFLDEEVDQLYDIYKKITKNPKILRSELKEWYDGYRAAAGDYLYNPRSVVCALRDNQLANYWTSSGTYDSIFNYIKGNIADVRNDLVLMVAGEHVPAKMQQYAATANALHTKDQIYSAMVVYGLLTYENGKVFIPNKELMDKFDELLLSNQQLGYVYDWQENLNECFRQQFMGIRIQWKRFLNTSMIQKFRFIHIIAKWNYQQL